MGSSSKGSSKSTTAPPAEILEAYKQSLNYAGQAINRPYEQYQGQLTAGLNPTQLQGIANVNAAQGAALPYIQQGAAYTNQAAQGVNPQMINQFMSPYLNTVVGATQRNLLESNAQQQNALKSQAIQSGAFGGDRARIGQAELARQQNLASGQVIGGLLNQGYGQALTGAQQNVQQMLAGGQQLGALGQSAQGAILQGAQAQLAAGAQQQATEQAQLQSAYDQYLQRQSYPYQQAQFYANIAQGIGAGAGGTTTQTPAAPNIGSQILGGISAIGSIGAMMSDERVKENIEPVGKTYDGQTIYKYNYKGDPKTQIGLIAQEVEQKHPEAVGSLGDIKMVDYDTATQDAADRAPKAYGGSSMGGLVTPSMQRENFAQGGFGMVPYADFFKGMSWVPEGALAYKGAAPGSTLPKGYSKEELDAMSKGSSFDKLNAMSKDDLGKIGSDWKGIGQDLGLVSKEITSGTRPEMGYEGAFSGLGSTLGSWGSSIGGFFGFADGGVVPRNGYEGGGGVNPGLPDELLRAESGNNFAADNGSGYVGRGQFGEARLADAKRAGVVPPDMTLDQFKNNPEVQKATEAWHVQDINNFVKERGLGNFIGTEINGVPVTPQGLLAVAHLGGKGGLENFIKSQGRYNPSDANGTSLMDYLAMGAGIQPAGGEATSTGVVPPPSASSKGSEKGSFLSRMLGYEPSDQAKMAWLAGSLATLGGRSPYFNVNVGQGAMTGMNTYFEGLKNQRETAKAAADIQSTLATAEATKADTRSKNMSQLYGFQQLYRYNKFNAQSRGEEYMSWPEFLSEMGLSGMGWERQDPNFGSGSAAPAAQGDAETTTSAPEAGGQAEETDAADAAPEFGVPNPAFTSENAPSVVIPASATNYNLQEQGVPPQNNPYLLLMSGVEADRKRGQEIIDRGYTVDMQGGQVNFRGGPQIQKEAERVAAINQEFARIQEQNAATKEVVRKISEILKRSGSDKLTTIRGEISGLLSGLGIGTREELENAKTSDLLTKLYKQLALTSDLQGAVSTAGIGKIQQVEAGSGSPTLVGPAAREIIGSLSGQLQWQSDMANDWAKFVARHNNTGITDAMRSQFVDMWNKKLPEYSKWGMANTPVEDASLFEASSNGQIPLTNFNVGWSYVMPDGSIKVFTGRQEDRYFVEAP